LVASGAEAQSGCPSAGSGVFALSGEVRQGDLVGRFTQVVEPRSGRFKAVDDFGILKLGSGFDGRLAWSEDMSGTSHFLTSDFARRLAVSEAWIKTHLACGPPPSAAGAARLRRTAILEGWRVTPPGGAPVELWFRRGTERLDHAVLQYSENSLIHHYSDWRRVASGVLLPFVIRDEDPEDESEAIYTVREAVKVSGASFVPRPAPNDSVIAGGATTTIKFEDDGRRRVYLPVYLNGKGPFAFELDNGGHFILTEETANALGLVPQGSFSSTGAGNAVHKSGYVPVDKLQVGNAEVVGQTAKVLPLSRNERPGKLPRAGILGLEFFQRFVVAIDHGNNTVSLQLFADAGTPRRGRPLPLLFDEDAPLVSGAFEGVPGNMMLDIGNAGPTIIEDDWAGKHGFRARLAKGVPRKSSKLSKGAVRLGPFELRDETVAYFGPAERGSEFTRSIAGIIGEPLLSRFNAVYDYSRSTVWLDPLPGAGPVLFDAEP
jgi:hypothetical protein